MAKKCTNCGLIIQPVNAGLGCSVGPCNFVDYIESGQIKAAELAGFKRGIELAARLVETLTFVHRSEILKHAQDDVADKIRALSGEP